MRRAASRRPPRPGRFLFATDGAIYRKTDFWPQAAAAGRVLCAEALKNALQAELLGEINEMDQLCRKFGYEFNTVNFKT
jgi:hypothetical protein